MFVRRSLSKILFIALTVLTAISTITSAQVVGHLPGFLPRFKHVATIPGGILDVRGNDVLYTGADNIVASVNLDSQKTTVFYTYEYSNPLTFLTPNGILAFGTEAFQIDGDERIPLGDYGRGIPEFPDYVVDGGFGILEATNGLVLRDFVARTNCVISTTPGFADVASNGAVVFTTPIDATNKAIRWFQNGETKTVGISPSYEMPYVATDGTNILWSERHGTYGQQYPFGSIFLQTGSGEKIEVATNTHLVKNLPVPRSVPRYRPVALNNGWAVFPRFTPAHNNTVDWMDLYRRAPDGTISRITDFGAMVIALGEDGRALVSSNGSLYYIPTVGPPKFISGDYPLAGYFTAGNKFFVYGPVSGYDGARIYEIEVEEDPFGIIYPTYNKESQVFSFGLIPAGPGDYELQRTTDFDTWTPVTTFTSVNGYPFEVEVASPPGFFRLRRL